MVRFDHIMIQFFFNLPLRQVGWGGASIHMSLRQKYPVSVNSMATLVISYIFFPQVWPKPIMPKVPKVTVLKRTVTNNSKLTTLAKQAASKVCYVCVSKQSKWLLMSASKASKVYWRHIGTERTGARSNKQWQRRWIDNPRLPTKGPLQAKTQQQGKSGNQHKTKEHVPTQVKKCNSSRVCECGWKHF